MKKNFSKVIFVFAIVVVSIFLASQAEAASITVQKSTGEVGYAGTKFFFDIIGPGYNSVIDIIIDATGFGSKIVQVPGGGNYTVTEQTPPPAPFEFVQVTCTYPGGGGSTETDPSIVVNLPNPISQVTCNFGNTIPSPGQATLRITKVINTAQSTNLIGNYTFGFQASGPTPFPESIAMPPPYDSQTTTAHVVTPGTYSITETLPGTDWFNANITCSNGTGTTNTATPAITNVIISENEDVECIFTNYKYNSSTPPPGNAFLVIVKCAIGGEEGDAFPFSVFPTPSGWFDIETDNPPPSDPDGCPDGTTWWGKENLAVPAGGYTITEEIPIGWEFVDATCNNSFTDPAVNDGLYARIGVLVEDGPDTICWFTNTKTGNLIIRKYAIGGNAPFDYRIARGSQVYPNTITINAVNGQWVESYSVELYEDFYDILEILPDGWNLNSAECHIDPVGGTTGDYVNNASFKGVKDVYVQAGATTYCDFTNTKGGRVKIIKETTGGNGQFDFSVNGPGEDPPSVRLTTAGDPTGHAESEWISVMPGVVDVIEQGPPNDWILDDKSCTPGGGQPIPNVPNGIRIIVDPGVDYICTFHDTKRGNLKIIKIAHGGGPTGTSFGYSIDGISLFGGVRTSSNGRGESALIPLNPGAHTLIEGLPNGWAFVSVVCTPGGPSSQTNNIIINIVAGQTTICTFENTREGGLIIIKDTTALNGNFGFEIEGPISRFRSSMTRHITTTGTVNSTGAPGGTGTFDEPIKVGAGSYTISENLLNGWVSNGVVCSNGSSSTTGTVTNVIVTAGNVTTCKFTNTPIGSIKIVKSATGGNGTFNFTVGGPTVPNPQPSITTSNGTGSTTINNLKAGNAYSIAESVPAGWTFVSAKCNDGTSVSSGNGATGITVGIGTTTTCTFTDNKDTYTPTQANIKIIKITEGGNGSFGFIIDGPTVPNPQPTITTVNGTGSNGANGQTVSPGTYNVTENIPAGWRNTSASCTNKNGSTGTPGIGKVTGLSAIDADTTTCTFVNTRESALTIIKNAPGANNGDTFNFNLTPFPLVASVVINNGTGTSSPVALDEGEHIITEQPPSTDWTLSSVNCDSVFVYDEETGQTIISLEPGETANCTFVNTITGSLVIEKITSGGNGTFTYTVAGPTSPISKPSITTLNSYGSTTMQNLSSGNYNIAEDPTLNWTMTSAYCNDTTSQPGTNGMSNVTVQSGQITICTFSNTVNSSGSINIEGNRFKFQQEIIPQ